MTSLPAVENPAQYVGLYVVDFGDQTAVGYTVDEVAMLLESERYADAKVYRIVRASPSGEMELKGVSSERFALEAGMFFFRNDQAAAEADFAALCDWAERAAPPGRAFVQLADRGPASGEDGGRGRYVTALVYPAELDDAFAQWLLDGAYAGGDWVEGGISAVTNYYDDEKTILAREQLWSAESTARSREEVLESTRKAVQR